MRFTRVTLFFIAFIITLGFYQLAQHFLADVEPQTFQATEEAMVDVANLLAEMVEPEVAAGTFDKEKFRKVFEGVRERRLEAKIFNYTKRDVGMNIYITDARGKVTFDSKDGKLEGHDYTKWADVRLTLAGKYGARSTRSASYDAGSSIMYVAAPVGDASAPLGVLTVWKQQKDMRSFVVERRRIIYMACGMIGCGILFLIAAVFLWLFRPIGQITEYARSIERGERPSKPRIGIGREVNTLAHALDSMRDSLEGRQYAERYIQTLTHEMKSPLAAIRGAAELLHEEMPEETRKRFLANILAETARSERLINRLLELAAIESMKRLEATGEVDLRAVLAAAVKQAAPLAEVAKVTIRHETDDKPVTTRGDAFILRAAMTNLLENALDFSPPGSEVEVALTVRERQAELTIRDHGPGIPEFARDKVFERFYSLRHHTAGRKGTGLGLTLVKEAVDLHGGTITLEPVPDGGTVARLTLPLE